jgi:hypothetical protein
MCFDVDELNNKLVCSLQTVHKIHPKYILDDFAEFLRLFDIIIFSNFNMEVIFCCLLLFQGQDSSIVITLKLWWVLVFSLHVT